jgi:hypothetical protein
MPVEGMFPWTVSTYTKMLNTWEGRGASLLTWRHPSGLSRVTLKHAVFKYDALTPLDALGSVLRCSQTNLEHPGLCLDATPSTPDVLQSHSWSQE